MSILANPKDPLRSGPPPAQVLMERFGQVAQGFPVEVVVDAAMNVVINCMRQRFSARVVALMSYDELVGKAKTVLEGHYDRVTGGRRNVFAHTQHVVMDTHKDPDL